MLEKGILLDILIKDNFVLKFKQLVTVHVTCDMKVGNSYKMDMYW